MKSQLVLLEKKLKKLYAMRPFSGSEMKKIREIFRIEYNYNSNHIEWNSLTMQETRSLLLLEIDSSNTKALTEKRKRDKKEMIWHDDAVKHLWLLDKLDFTEVEMKSDLKITHKLIKELNKIILVENYKKRVIDENWDQFFVDVILWQYKSKNNHVKRRDGSIFNFSEYTETHALMQDLINWFENNKNKMHPIVLATMFHYKFIRIHPFDDGNWRVCRLLINMILMNVGYPLFIVPSSQKEEYYDLLEYMDWKYPDIYDAIKDDNSEIYEPFIDYFSNRVLWSIDKMIWVRKRKQLRKFIYSGISILVLLWIFVIFNNLQNNDLTNNDTNILYTWTENNITKYENISEVVNTENCDIIDNDGLTSLWYKYIDIFSWEVRNPKAVSGNYKEYTDQFYVQPWFKEAYLCVVANVIPSLQNEDGNYYLWILFNDQEYEGLVNVAINSKWTPYDYTSEWADQRLTGRMYWLDLKEHDKNYRLDLNWVIVWVSGWWYKIIKPIDRLNLWNQKTLMIWGYVSAGENWIIKKFRIFYKWWFIDNLK